MVAKSYQQYEIEGEPFEESKRWYVNVHTTKGLKKVRWYSDAEYKKMYPDAPVEDIMMTFNARHAFGFREAGYITLYQGNEDVIRDWARAEWPPKAWYNETFHFYTPSFIDAGQPPEGITTIHLTWDEVKQDDIHMKSHEEVRKYLNYNDSMETVKSYSWAPGDWLEEKVTIKDKTTKEGYLGESHTFIMSDSKDNIYIWTTSSKNYEIGMVVKLKMKVKELKDGHTVVWYCKEV